MSFAIEFTDVTDMEVQHIHLRLMGRSLEQAERWQEGLENAASSLADFPRRCPLAPEHDVFDVEVRQLLYGTYRLLFGLRDTDDDGEYDTVRILHVRHASQRPLYHKEPDEDDTK